MGFSFHAACAHALECSFMPQQAGRVAVLVQLRGEGVGGSPFFISFGAGPTAAAQCSLRLSDGAPPPTAGQPLQLTLRAADAAANARRQGGDRFVVSVHGAAQFDVAVRDCGDGSPNPDPNPIPDPDPDPNPNPNPNPDPNQVMAATRAPAPRHAGAYACTALLNGRARWLPAPHRRWW